MTTEQSESTGRAPLGPPAGGRPGEPRIEEMVRANEANWDARTPVHVASAFYGLDGSRRADDWFASFEWADLGALTDRDVLHLQCHLGTETAAFADRGARAVGLDFSAEAVAAARRLAEESGRAMEFVHADVYRAREALGDRRFDVIYTGKGAVCYLPDLATWAETVAELLRPGGTFYLVEFHPLLNALGPTPPADPDTPPLLLRHDYLAGRGALRSDSPTTYTDGPPLTGATTSYEWRHGLGEVVSAVVGAGLRVELLRETEELPWPRFPSMVPTANGWWRLPDAEPIVPLLYALKAAKP